MFGHLSLDPKRWQSSINSNLILFRTKQWRASCEMNLFSWQRTPRLERLQWQSMQLHRVSTITRGSFTRHRLRLWVIRNIVSSKKNLVMSAWWPVMSPWTSLPVASLWPLRFCDWCFTMVAKLSGKWHGLFSTKCIIWEIRNAVSYGKRQSFYFQNKLNTVFCQQLFRIHASLQNGSSKSNNSHAQLFTQTIDRLLFSIIFFQREETESIWSWTRKDSSKIRILQRLLLC